MVERTTERSLNNIDLVEQMKIEVCFIHLAYNSKYIIVLDQTPVTRFHCCLGHIKRANKTVSTRSHD